MRDTVVVKFIPPEKWYKRAKWELMEDYTSVNQEVNVPAGFITDGASIPMFFRWIFSPTGKYFGAAIVHDYILVKEWNWQKANDQFDQEMKALGVKKWRRLLILSAVKIWGWIQTKILRKQESVLAKYNKHLLGEK